MNAPLLSADHTILEPGFFWLLGPLLMVLFCTLGMFLCRRVCAAGNCSPWPRNTTTMDHSPMEIAELRYARGEITKEQFEEIKRTLR